MIIKYNFKCMWNFEKKEKISGLITERIILLTGIKFLEKIKCINFCEKEMVKCQTNNSYLLCDDRFAFFNTNETKDIKVYEITLEKDILLSMLIPGAGQSYFDNIVLKLKNVAMQLV